MKLPVFFFTYIENCAFLFLLKFCLPKISELNLYLSFSKPMETYGFYIYLVNVSLFLKSGPKFFFYLACIFLSYVMFLCKSSQAFCGKWRNEWFVCKHKETIYFYCIASLSLFFFQGQMFVKNSNWLWWAFHTHVSKRSHTLSSSRSRAVLAQGGVWVMSGGKGYWTSTPKAPAAYKDFLQSISENNYTIK